MSSPIFGQSPSSFFQLGKKKKKKKKKKKSAIVCECKEQIKKYDSDLHQPHLP